ncbi:hypothetical protein ACXR2T_09945 [Leucobacter sp. HY1910]
MGGSAPKYYDPERDAFIKLDAMQHEAVREEFASRVAVIMSLENAVQYDAKQYLDPATGEALIGVESENFKGPEERERLLSHFDAAEFVDEDDDWDSDDEFFIENDDWKRVKAQIETMNRAADTDVGPEALKMAAFDIIIGNTDRTSNLSNIGVLQQEDGSCRLIPPFDFGMAFPPEEEYELLDQEALIDRARSFAAFTREQYGYQEPLLTADPAEMRAFIAEYDNPLYSEDEVRNIKRQLTDNLSITEGILWRRK